MHYIRLMRPPSLDQGHHLKLVLTITTDLGDAFLCPQDPVPISVYLHNTQSTTPDSSKICLTPRKKGKSTTFWKAGMRVLKLDLPVPAAVVEGVRVATAGNDAPAPLIRTVASHELEDPPHAVDVSFDSLPRVLAAAAPFPLSGQGSLHVASRQFTMPDGTLFAVEEGIGESIDRHIWDAGVVATGVIMHMLLTAPGKSSAVWAKMHRLRELLSSAMHEGRGPPNFIELGCGVGVLGLGLAAGLRAQLLDGFKPSAQDEASPGTILLTDLPDAEELAGRNISRLEASMESCEHQPMVQVQFESLDWEDGKRGLLGPKASASSWDLILISDCTYNVDMLPALVKTISALHDFSRQGGNKGPEVMLATKPRHASEKELFNLMRADGWAILESASLPLPLLGMEDESVEMYIFGKREPSRLHSSGSTPDPGPKRRRLR